MALYSVDGLQPMTADAIRFHPDLPGLCRHYGVLRLDLFGSAAAGTEHREQSDLDFLVEFIAPSSAGYADDFFGFKEALERLFERSVDLVVASAIRNPYFLESVQRARRPVYAA